MADLPAARSGSREEILALLLAATVGAGIGVAATYALQKSKAAKAPIDVTHAVVVDKPLKDIAAEAGIQPPTALAHLRKLEDEGKVQKVDTPAGPRYALQPFLRCEWHDPDHGVQQTWQSKVAVDWRFPLVSRVPDPLAQTFLLEWLDRAQARGILPKPRSRFEPGQREPSLSIVVYGSCARGDARATSDVDILLAGDLPKRDVEALKDLADEIGLRGGRRPDIRVVGADLKGAGAAFIEALRREGRTIFTTLPEPAFIERMAPLVHA
jgi:predicted nucleotidyltransferase